MIEYTNIPRYRPPCSLVTEVHMPMVAIGSASSETGTRNLPITSSALLPIVIPSYSVDS